MPALLLLASLSLATAGEALVTETRPAVGTLVSISLAGVAPGDLPAAMAAAFAPFERIEEVANEWREGSPLAALNASAGSGQWTPLPPETCQILELALEGAHRTGGRFDPTWAALSGLWRFGDGQDGTVPPAPLLAERCRLVGFRGVTLEHLPEGGCRARLARRGMQVGLGGIAKGWAVDRAVEALRALGHRDFLVQAGGDLYAAGLDRGRPWRVGVRDPRGPLDRTFASLDVSDRAFSTSGDYERFFLAGGRRYHHVIDPRSCRPAAASRSVTILARSAVEAEVLSKAAFIRGGEPALRMVERARASALIVTARNRVLVSPALRGRLQLGRPSP